MKHFLITAHSHSPPRRVQTLPWQRVGITLMALALATLGQPQAVVHDWSSLRGIGYSTARTADGTKYFVGGSVYNVGPPTGMLAFLDRSSFAPDLTMPRVLDDVNTIVEDGAGGWFIGGQFTRVNGLDRQRLVRILADGSLSDWTVDISGSVKQLLTYDDILIVFGSFWEINGEERADIAALSISTGELLPWAPNFLDISSPGINSIALQNGILYVGGNFQTVNGQARDGLAALDLNTGALLPWTQDRDGLIDVVHATPQGILVGGSFDTMGGLPRKCIAMLDPTTGEVLPWDAGITAGVRVTIMASDQDRVYFAGRLTTIQGQSRNDMASVDLSSATLLPFHVTGSTPTLFNDMKLMGDTLLVAAPYQSNFDNLAAFDAETGERLLLNMHTGGGTVHCIWVGDERVLIGGTFLLMTSRYTSDNVVAVDGATGAELPWRLNPDQFGANPTQVKAMLIKGDTLFFTVPVMGVSGGGRLCAIDVNTGDYLGMSLHVNVSMGYEVYDLALEGNTLYVVGSFTQVNGEPRGYGAAWDLANDALLDWDPQANSSINTLAIHEGAVYLGGFFTTLGGESRQRFGAVDALSGEVLPVDLPCNSSVYDLVISGDTLFIGGSFASIGGETRTCIAITDLNSNTLLPWAPDVQGANSTGTDKGVYAFAVVGNIVHVGGNFFWIEGTEQRSYARLDRWTGLPLGQVASVRSGYVRALHGTEELTVATGGFTVVNDYSRSGMFAIGSCPLKIYYPDEDGDGFGDPTGATVECEPGPDGYVDNALDCDDGDDQVWTGGPCVTASGAAGTWSDECICITTTGVGAHASPAGLGIFPNPSSGRVHLQVPAHGDMLLSVIDLSGRTVHTERIVATGTSTHALELSHLGAGIYILRLDHPTGPYTTRLVRH